MKKTDIPDLALSVSAPLPQADDHAAMPAEFAGMYQAGFDAGYNQGKESGYRQGFAEGIAAGQPGPNGASVQSTSEGKPAPKTGPRRMLIGMPCTRCRVYLLSEETHCPCCKQPVKEH